MVNRESTYDEVLSYLMNLIAILIYLSEADMVQISHIHFLPLNKCALRYLFFYFMNFGYYFDDHLNRSSYERIINF
jgi:hypothetical protein